MKKRNQRIRVLLVDDHPVVRKGIRAFLDGVGRLEVVGEAADGENAVAQVKELTPDVVLMDVEMPGIDGLEATQVLRRDCPQTRVLILSAHSERENVLRIIQSGAQGYVLKDAPLPELPPAIEAVHSGEAFFSPDIEKMMLSQYLAEARGDQTDAPAKKLSDREREVLALIADGQSNKDMANQLGVAVRTIETHRERVMDKLNIHHVAGLTKYAILNGLVKLQASSAAAKAG